MKIELTNTKDDLASFYQFDRWYSDERKNYRIKARLIGGTIATIPLLLIVINSDNAKVNSVSGLVIFGLLFFSLGFLGAKHSILSSLKGLANRVANDKANHEFLEPLAMEFTADRISWTSKSGHGQSGVEIIKKIGADEKYY